MAPRLKTSPRKQPQQRRAQETVEAILKATAQVVVRHGYEGANTNRIAEAAGVSVGSLYQYFPSKEALIVALIEEHCDDMWAVFVQKTAESWNLPVAESVDRVIAALFDAHRVDPRLHRVLHEQVPRVGKLAKIRDVTERSIEVTKHFLEAHKDELVVKDPALAAFTLVYAVEALIHGVLSDDAPEREKVLAEAATLVKRYLGVG